MEVSATKLKKFSSTPNKFHRQGLIKLTIVSKCFPPSSINYQRAAIQTVTDAKREKEESIDIGKLIKFHCSVPNIETTLQLEPSEKQVHSLICLRLLHATSFISPTGIGLCSQIPLNLITRKNPRRKMLILAPKYRAEVYFGVKFDWVKALEISFFIFISSSRFFSSQF